jgi:hypothetical protein
VAYSALGGDRTSVLGPPAPMAYRDDPTHAGAWLPFPRDDVPLLTVLVALSTKNSASASRAVPHRAPPRLRAENRVI